MKLALICLVVLIGVVAGEVSDSEWSQYKEKFSKNYPCPVIDAKHRSIYSATKNEIEEHNKKFEAGEVSWSMGINQFADLSSEEINKSAFGLLPPPGKGASRASLRESRASLRESREASLRKE